MSITALDLFFVFDWSNGADVTSFYRRARRSLPPPLPVMIHLWLTSITTTTRRTRRSLARKDASISATAKKFSHSSTPSSTNTSSRYAPRTEARFEHTTLRPTLSMKWICGSAASVECWGWTTATVSKSKVVGANHRHFRKVRAMILSLSKVGLIGLWWKCVQKVHLSMPIYKTIVKLSLR